MKKALLINLIMIVLLVIAWCIWDYFAVKQPDYPEGVHDHDWIFYMVPIIPFVMNFVTIKTKMTPRILLSLTGSIIVTILSLLGILFFGINFHLSIGGTL